MSTTPPPPFQPQPSGFPPAPPGPPAPQWQGAPPSGVLTEPSPPPKRSKLPIVIGAIVVAVATIAVIAFVVTSGDDDDAADDGGVNSAEAHSGLEVVIEDASFDDDGNDELSRCPFGRIDELVTLVGDAVDLDRDVIDGTELSGAVEEGDLPAYVFCQVSADAEVSRGPETVYYQAVLDPPRDYKGYVTDFAGDDTKITFEESEDYLGGEIIIYCAEDVTGDGYMGCDADWNDSGNDIALNIFLAGSDVEAGETVDALKAVLPVLADQLATHAVTENES